MSNAPALNPSRLAALAPAGAGVLILVAVVAPKALAVILIGAAIYLAAEIARAQTFPVPASFGAAPAAAAVALFGLYALMSSLWSVDRLGGLAGTLTLIGCAGVTLGCLWLAERAPAGSLGRVLAAVTLAVALSALIVAIDVLTGQGLRRFGLTYLPLVRPRGMTDADIANLGPAELDRTLSVLNLAFWPALLVLNRIGGRSWTLQGTLLALLTAVATLPSMHGSSKVALVGGAIIFALSYLSRAAARYVLIAAWAAATLLVVPAIEIGYYRLDLNHARWLPPSARDRMELWSFTADHVADHPLLGAGAGSVRELDNEKRTQGGVRARSQDFERRFAPHSHNFYLQTWFELGGAGALLLFLAGLATILRIGKLPPATEPYALALFTASAGLAAFSYGMWQAWFLALFAFAAILMALATAGVDRGGPSRG